MKAFGFLVLFLVALAYIVAGIAAFIVTLPFQIYNFACWFLDSRFTPHK